MKYILLFILFICSSNIIKAQDTLSMRSGENMLVKVIEVGTTEVKYKKLDNLNGPVFSILKSDLLMIKYENGTSEDYSKQERALIKVKKRHTVRNIGIVYGVLGVGVSIALISAFRGGFRGGFFGIF
jgi:hypothetical protein